MSKKEKVLKHLQRYGTITSWEAFQEYGATRLASIIFELRKEGHAISTCESHGVDCYGKKNTFATYKLIRSATSTI